MRDAPRRVPDGEVSAQTEYAQIIRGMEKRPRLYHIVTFGCQMNARDSETLSGILDSMGLSPAEKREDADIVLHNTCCIRDNAERKALGNIVWLKELKKEKPDLIIGVCGCMAQQEGMAEKLLKRYPFIDLIFGTSRIWKLPELLYRVLTEGRAEDHGEDGAVCEGMPARRPSPYQAFVNVMYGCDNFCTYCIVPYVRGRERSRKLGDILRETEELLKGGVKEITLLGQNVNSYGKDTGENVSFARLLREVTSLGVPRVRFMTSHPKDLSDELIDEMAHNQNVCPHLHLPAQSGSDRILSLMNRRYTREEYLRKVEKLRAAKPEIGLTTDLIVAFPGETEEDFSQTLELAKIARYDSAYTFIYSPRPGTKAAEMPSRVPEEIAKERIERLIALQEGITGEILASLNGSEVTVLCEGPSRRRSYQMTGKCGRNISVNYTGNAQDTGKLVRVRVTGAGSNTLRGTQILEEEPS